MSVAARELDARSTLENNGHPLVQLQTGFLQIQASVVRCRRSVSAVYNGHPLKLQCGFLEEFVLASGRLGKNGLGERPSDDQWNLQFLLSCNGRMNYFWKRLWTFLVSICRREYVENKSSLFCDGSTDIVQTDYYSPEMRQNCRCYPSVCSHPAQSFKTRHSVQQWQESAKIFNGRIVLGSVKSFRVIPEVQHEYHSHSKQYTERHQGHGVGGVLSTGVLQ